MESLTATDCKFTAKYATDSLTDSWKSNSSLVDYFFVPPGISVFVPANSVSVYLKNVEVES